MVALRSTKHVTCICKAIRCITDGFFISQNFKNISKEVLCRLHAFAGIFHEGEHTLFYLGIIGYLVAEEYEHDVQFFFAERLVELVFVEAVYLAHAPANGIALVGAPVFFLRNDKHDPRREIAFVNAGFKNDLDRKMGFGLPSRKQLVQRFFAT